MIVRAMKIFLSIVALLLFLLFVVSIYDSYRFPRKFNQTLENQKDIEMVVEALGKPNYVNDKENLHSEITSDSKNKNAFEVYYWSNGIHSYHYVVVDQSRKVINYKSEGW